MSFEVLLTDDAARDLEEICAYIDRHDSPSRADYVHVAVDQRRMLRLDQHQADGPILGAHSMLSLGVAAFDAEGVLRDIFAANLEQLDGATDDPRTIRWWVSQSYAWEAARAELQPLSRTGRIAARPSSRMTFARRSPSTRIRP